jgi:short-subunit dehydrogenase
MLSSRQWPTLFAIPHLKASRGAIVVVSSMYGLLTAPYQTAYSASKHALSGFFDSLRPELAAHSVSITLHHPGGVATEVTSKFTDARGARSSLDLPAAFMASADACAQSVLEAANVRAADEAFPFYVRAFASLRAASPALFDALFFRLNEFYFDAGIMQLKQTATP